MTALQMVSAFSAVANGGRLLQPQIVRATLDAEGRETRRALEPRVVRQVISPETARTLTEIMTAVVAQRHRPQGAPIPGYDVAGKTGTAQKLDPATRRYSRAPGVLSFVGFVPVERSAADHARRARRAAQTETWRSARRPAPIFASIGGAGAALPRRAARRRPRRSALVRRRDRHASAPLTATAPRSASTARAVGR